MLFRLKCIGLRMITHPSAACLLAISTYVVFYVFYGLWIDVPDFDREADGVLWGLLYVCYAVGIGQLASRSTLAGAILATCIITVRLGGFWRLRQIREASDGHILTPYEEGGRFFVLVTFLF